MLLGFPVFKVKIFVQGFILFQASYTEYGLNTRKVTCVKELSQCVFCAKPVLVFSDILHVKDSFILECLSLLWINTQLGNLHIQSKRRRFRFRFQSNVNEP